MQKDINIKELNESSVKIDQSINVKTIHITKESNKNNNYTLLITSIIVIALIVFVLFIYKSSPISINTAPQTQAPHLKKNTGECERMIDGAPIDGKIIGSCD